MPHTRSRIAGLGEDEAVGAIGAFVLVGTETLVSHIPRLIRLRAESGWPPWIAGGRELVEILRA